MSKQITFDISTESGLAHFLSVVAQMRLSGKRVTVQLVEATKHGVTLPPWPQKDAA